MMHKKQIALGVSAAAMIMALGVFPALAASPVVEKWVTTPPSEVTHAPAADLPRAAEPIAPPPAVNEVSTEQGMRLEEAMGEAYNRNPALAAARAELRSVDESYAQAAAGYRPFVSGDASYVSTTQDGDETGKTHGDPKTLSVEVTQPLYRGGSTTANIQASDNTIKAQRALLKVAEKNVLLDVVTGFMDVMRDHEIVELNRNNEKVLFQYLTASSERFRLGDITKTDVSQAEARLAEARANTASSEADLKSSRAAFEKVVGILPAALVKPATPPGLPSSLEEAISQAEKKNPSLVFARFSSAAAAATTRSIKGEMLPQIDLSGSVGRIYDPAQSRDEERDTSSIALRATIPFYTGGSTYSRIRQSRQIEQQRRSEIFDTERTVRQNVIDAWEDLAAASARMTARESQINATRLALEGVQIETEYGTRTTLDLLDAEQEYLDARVAHIISERDRIVAAYTLLAALGQLNAENLQLNVNRYNPDHNFQKVKGQWFGADITEN